MTDKELIQALRCCGSTNDEVCKDCPVKKECHETIGNPAALSAAYRLEALLTENERLKAGKDTNVPTDHGIAEAFADQWGSFSPTVEKG